MANLIDLYLVYRILRKLTTPFSEWEAFKQGVIDAEGNILKNADQRVNDAQRDSFTKFDLLILKVKKLIEKLPFGKTKLANYAAALYLIKEEKNITEENVEENFLIFLEQREYLTEDAPVNNVGSGNIAGTGDNPPVGKKAQKVLLRRFANNDVFVVDSSRFRTARLAKKKYVKYERYVGTDDIGNAIREYGRKYPKRPIILQDEKTGAMTFLRYGRSGMFTESYKG